MGQAHHHFGFIAEAADISRFSQMRQDGLDGAKLLDPLLSGASQIKGTHTALSNWCQQVVFSKASWKKFRVFLWLGCQFQGSFSTCYLLSAHSAHASIYPTTNPAFKS